MPELMNPIAKRTLERFPATGFSACAASAALLTGLWWAPRVAAVEPMIENMISAAKAIPVNTSSRPFLSRRFAWEASLSASVGAASPPRSSARRSSTRSADCQKIMYGEIVVPSTATARPRYADEKRK